MTDTIHRVATIVGNFGITFITPLSGLAIFDPSTDLTHKVIISLWVSGLGAILSICRELADWGAYKNESKE